ncbi:MAG: hypothetical protein E2O57_04470 [Gammaproteobacteria bacterium]|nr:MAG: hypothetical protein E2O57_04470 [Gammaproteobacteria bacterium]
MMNPDQLISHAKDRGIELSVTSDYDLKASSNKDLLTQEAIDFLKINKESIVDQLCNYEFQAEVFRIINPDDIGLVVKAVKTISGRHRLEVLNHYLREFDQGYEAESNPVKKRNAGSYRANTWLLKKRTLDLSNRGAA